MWWKVGDQWADEEYKKFGHGGGGPQGAAAEGDYRTLMMSLWLWLFLNQTYLIQILILIWTRVESRMPRYKLISCI